MFLGLFVLWNVARQSKIAKYDLAVRANQQILTLDVSVDQAALVNERDAAETIVHHGFDVLCLQLSAIGHRIQHMFQIVFVEVGDQKDFIEPSELSRLAGLLLALLFRSLEWLQVDEQVLVAGLMFRLELAKTVQRPHEIHLGGAALVHPLDLFGCVVLLGQLLLDLLKAG